MASNQGNDYEIRKQLAKLPGLNQQCDVILQIGLESFMANKNVLMLRMDYFRGMFTANMQEKDKTIIKLDPEIIDSEVFDDILDYVYTLKINFKTTKLESLYKAVDFFCFDELKTKIENFMKSNINMNNVSTFFDIAMEHNLKITKDCKRFIISNPLLSSKARPAVGYLDFIELSTLLQKQSSLSMFEEMFRSSIEWICHDEQKRSQRAFELLRRIPLGRLSLHFFKQVVSKNNIVKNDNKCLQLLLESAIAIPSVEELYVFGGKDGTRLSSMSIYDSSTRQWFGSAPLPSTLSLFAYCVANRKIYVCGGYNGENEMKELYMFDRNTHQWTTLKAMKYRRQGCAMAFLDGHLYVAGGYNDYNQELSVVERYSIQNNDWEDVSSMIHKRNGLELVQLDGFLYALGGNDGNNVRKSLEQYNPHTGKWTTLTDMNRRFSYFGSAVFENRIYVVGKNFCEEYDPEEDEWRTMASPTECGYGRRLAVFDGKLHAIGGEIGGTEDWKGIKTVEYYDSEKRRWIAVEDMNIGRCYHGVAVITRTYTPR